MNHALLPVIGKANLPAKYLSAKLALNECSRIDECKTWADKTQALASYARQSRDKDLLHLAMRIHARAIRRCGELLKEVEKAHGANQNIRRGESPNVSTRKIAAANAGLSPDQAKAAIRVANVNGDLFEEQVESDNPPTVSALAKQGRATLRGIPHYEKLGMTKKAFQAGMYFRGSISTYITALERDTFQDIIDGSTKPEINEIRAGMDLIEKYHSKLKAKL